MKMIIVILLFISGIYFSIKLKFKNYNIFSMIKSMKINEPGISKFSSLCISLASKVGVGSLSGAAIAIYYGGVGTIFWMWITTILTSSNTMVESILSLKYKTNIGGPFNYIKKALNNKIAIIYALILLLAYLLGFLPIQVNTISKVVVGIINIKEIIIGIIVSILISFVIFNGIDEISKIVTKLIPFITFIYVFSCLIIIINNISLMDNIIKIIVNDAFNIKSMLSGFIIGSTKSIFSTETGLGTNAIASSSVSKNDVLETSLVQTFGTFFDTFVITTLTVFVILLSPYNYELFNNINGIEITYFAFIYNLGKMGGLILTISIILFAIATLLSGYYYIDVAFKYIFNKESIICKILFIITIVISSVISPNYIWNLIDIFIVLLGLINILSLFLLRKDVK